MVCRMSNPNGFRTKNSLAFKCVLEAGSFCDNEWHTDARITDFIPCRDDERGLVLRLLGIIFLL